MSQQGLVPKSRERIINPATEVMEDFDNARRVLAEFFLRTPLYQEFDLSQGDGRLLAAALSMDFQMQFDGYCPGCKRDTICNVEKAANTSGSLIHEQDWFGLRPDMGTRIARCGRHDGHPVWVAWARLGNKYRKTGQWPTLGDIATSDLKQFQKILSEDESAELKTAVYLAAHGLGIGALTYLRRIFETVIANCSKQVAGLPDNFGQLEIAAKIKCLRHVLPPFVVKNRNIYAILSKGIHELTEEECLRYFPILNSSICLILEQQLERRSREATETKLTSELNAIHSGLSTKRG